MRIMNGIYEKVDYSTNSSILLHNNKEADNYPIHWHTAVEMIMPIKNIYSIKINHEIYELNEGDVLIIPPGELHELFAPDHGMRRILLFDFSLISNINGFSNILSVLNQPRLITPLTTPTTHLSVQNIFNDISDEYNSDNNFREASIYSSIIQIFVLVGRKYMNTESLFPDVKQSKQKEYIEKFNIVFEYIDKNYAEEITLDTTADVAGFSKFHFSRLFKQFTDMSFYDYLNQKRVRHAEHLLLDPALSITEVATRSGFSSISTFNRVFKGFKKCTPSEFKNLYRHRNKNYKEK